MVVQTDDEQVQVSGGAGDRGDMLLVAVKYRLARQREPVHPVGVACFKSQLIATAVAVDVKRFDDGLASFGPGQFIDRELKLLHTDLVVEVGCAGGCAHCGIDVADQRVDLVLAARGQASEDRPADDAFDDPA